jgi:hypothetical protein
MKEYTFIIANLIALTTPLCAQQINNEVYELSKKKMYTGILISYAGTQKDNVKTTFENVIYSRGDETSIKVGYGYLF